MRSNQHELQVLRAYGIGAEGRRIESLGSAGGFSGAQFWRISGGGETLCLRRWPPDHPNAHRLRLIHAVLLSAAQDGLDFLPVPRATPDGATFVQRAGTLWEVCDWLPGQADYRAAPTSMRLRAAMQALARLHVATASRSPVKIAKGPAPGLTERFELLGEVASGLLERVADAVQRTDWPELRRRAERLLPLVSKNSQRVGRLLAVAVREQVDLQPCLRDIWHDHVLFVDQEVTGIIDFGALRIDCAMGDVARLMGSLVADETPNRRAALEAYDEIRPLSARDRALIEAYDAGNVLLSGVNWLRWIGLEDRRFEQPERVLQRLDEWLERLSSATQSGR